LVFTFSGQQFHSLESVLVEEIKFPISWTVIAVNATEKRLEATIDLSDLNVTGRPVVLFEQDRPCAFNGGTITDAFSADGTHVYKITSLE